MGLVFGADGSYPHRRTHVLYGSAASFIAKTAKSGRLFEIVTRGGGCYLLFVAFFLVFLSTGTSLTTGLHIL